MADVLPDFAGGGSQFKEAIPVLPVNPDGTIGSSMSALVDYIPVTPSNSLLANGTCRGILVTVAGTVNLTTPAGLDRDGVPCSVGANPYCASKIRAGGTATGIFAGY